MDKKAIEIYNAFMLFCDGCYDYIEPLSSASTYQMAVTKLYYDNTDNVLHIHLRRPGILIGKGGSNYNSLKEYLGCEIHIHEVKNLWD